VRQKLKGEEFMVVMNVNRAVMVNGGVEEEE
jgi:hypothetical protein